MQVNYRMQRGRANAQQRPNQSNIDNLVYPREQQSGHQDNSKMESYEERGDKLSSATNRQNSSQQVNILNPIVKKSSGDQVTTNQNEVKKKQASAPKKGLLRFKKATNNVSLIVRDQSQIKQQTQEDASWSFPTYLYQLRDPAMEQLQSIREMVMHHYSKYQTFNLYAEFDKLNDFAKRFKGQAAQRQESQSDALVISQKEIQEEQDCLITYLMRFAMVYHVICLCHTLWNAEYRRRGGNTGNRNESLVDADSMKESQPSRTTSSPFSVFRSDSDKYSALFSISGLLWLLIKNSALLAINGKMSNVTFGQVGTRSANTRCLHNKFRLFSVLLSFQMMFGMIQTYCTADSDLLFTIATFQISFGIVWITVSAIDLDLFIWQVMMVSLSHLLLANQKMSEMREARTASEAVAGLQQPQTITSVLLKWLPLLMIVAMFPLIGNYLSKAFEGFSKVYCQFEKEKRHAQSLQKQLNKNYLIVKLSTYKENKRQIEMKLLEMSTSARFNMMRLAPKKNLIEQHNYNLTVVLGGIRRQSSNIKLVKSDNIDCNIDLLEENIFVPYVVSRQMIVKYESRSEQKFSIKQILYEATQQNENGDISLLNQRTQLYFRVPKQQSYGKKPNSPKASVYGSGKKWNKQYGGPGGGLEEICEEYHQNSIDFDDSAQKNDETLVSGLEASSYFEFELEEVKVDSGFSEPGQIMLSIRDITHIVLCQKKISDKVYQDALVANYSHEQYTPLNSILNGSEIVQRNVDQLVEFEEAKNGQKNKFLNDYTKSLLKSIQYSGRILKYFNDNQIQRMKIQKGEFSYKLSTTSEPEYYIKNIIESFQLQIENRQINVHIFKDFDGEKMYLHADWTKFKLVLFNLIQNSIKYNYNRGDIVFIMKLNNLPYSNKQIRTIEKQIGQNEEQKDKRFNKMLSVEIIDSGLGIDEERQQYLFTPFLELRIKQNIELCKNQSIGLGLSCSSLISQKLGGSLKLMESNKNDITVFKMEMPIHYEPINDQSNQGQQINSSSNNHHLMLFNFKRLIHQNVIAYLQKRLGPDAYNFQNICKQSANFTKDVNNSKQASGKIMNLKYIQDDNGSNDNQSMKNQELFGPVSVSEQSDDDLSKLGCDDIPKNHTFNQDLPGPSAGESKKFKRPTNQRLRPKTIMSDEMPILDRLNLRKKKKSVTRKQKYPMLVHQYTLKDIVKEPIQEMQEAAPEDKVEEDKVEGPPQKQLNQPMKKLNLKENNESEKNIIRQSLIGNLRNKDEKDKDDDDDDSLSDDLDEDDENDSVNGLEQIEEEKQEDIVQFIPIGGTSSQSSSMSADSGSNSNLLQSGSGSKQKRAKMRHNIKNGIKKAENGLELIQEEPAHKQNAGEQNKPQTDSRIAFNPKNRLGNFIQERVNPASEQQEQQLHPNQQQVSQSDNANGDQSQLVAISFRQPNDNDPQFYSYTFNRQAKEGNNKLVKIGEQHAPQSQHIPQIQPMQIESGNNNNDYNNINSNIQQQPARLRKNNSIKEKSVCTDDSIRYQIGAQKFFRASVKSDDMANRERVQQEQEDRNEEGSESLAENSPLHGREEDQDKVEGEAEEGQDQLEMLNFRRRGAADGGLPAQRRRKRRRKLSFKSKKNEALKILMGEPSVTVRTVNIEHIDRVDPDSAHENGQPRNQNKPPIGPLELKQVSNLMLHEEVQRVYGDSCCNINVNEDDDVSSGRLSNMIDFQQQQFQILESCLPPLAGPNNCQRYNQSNSNGQAPNRRLSGSQQSIHQLLNLDDNNFSFNQAHQQQQAQQPPPRSLPDQIEYNVKHNLVKRAAPPRWNQKEGRCQTIREESGSFRKGSQQQVDELQAIVKPQSRRSRSQFPRHKHKVGSNAQKKNHSHEKRHSANVVDGSRSLFDKHNELEDDMESEGSRDIVSKSCEELSLALQRIAYEKDVRKVISHLDENRQNRRAKRRKDKKNQGPNILAGQNNDLAIKHPMQAIEEDKHEMENSRRPVGIGGELRPNRPQLINNSGMVHPRDQVMSDVQDKEPKKGNFPEQPQRFSYSILKNDPNGASLEQFKFAVINQAEEGEESNQIDFDGIDGSVLLLNGNIDHVNEISVSISDQPHSSLEEDKQQRALANEDKREKPRQRQRQSPLIRGQQSQRNPKQTIHKINSRSSNMAVAQQSMNRQNQPNSPFQMQQPEMQQNDSGRRSSLASGPCLVPNLANRRRSVIQHYQSQQLLAMPGTRNQERGNYRSSKKLHQLVSSKIGSQKKIEAMLKSNNKKDSVHGEPCCKHKMLLVDDSDFNLQIVRYLIKQLFEIELTFASDGLQALNLFKEEYEKDCGCANRGFKLILMDINMPIMDGFESTQKILQFLERKNDADYAHIVALTSYAGDDFKQRCMRTGMKDMLTKPLHSKDMQIIIYKHFYRLTMDEILSKFPHLE